MTAIKNGFSMTATTLTAGGTLEAMMLAHTGSPTRTGMIGAIKSEEKQHAAETRHLRNWFGYGHAPVCRVHECLGVRMQQ